MSRTGHHGTASLVAAVMICLCLLPTTIRAAECTWQHDPSTPGDWLDPSNWDPSAPGSKDTAIIDNAGTASISGGSVKVQHTIVGNSLAGSVNQIGGVNAVGYHLYLGHNAGAAGAYYLGGGSLGSMDLTIGCLGTATFTQWGGINAVWFTVTLGDSPGGMGVYDLSGGSLHSNGVGVGYHGTGVFVQSGGTNATGALVVGYDSDSTGTYHLSGGVLTTASERLNGSFAQSGGSNSAGDLSLGYSSGNRGTYDLTAGRLKSATLYIGRGGTGSFTQSGGTHVVSSTACLGYKPGTTGTYALSGGSMASRYLNIGQEGTGHFIQSGGTLTAWFVSLGGQDGTSYDLTGGLFESTHLDMGVGEFTQSGGTHVVADHLSVGGSSAGPKGTYCITGGMLDARNGFVHVEGGTFAALGGTLLAGTMYGQEGSIAIGPEATVCVGDLGLASQGTFVTRLGLGKTRSAAISGALSPASFAMIVGAGVESTGLVTLDLQTGPWRPVEGDAFCVLAGFGTIYGMFDQITTNVSAGQQNDPNGAPIPFFGASIIPDPNSPGKVAMQVTFQGLTAGDASGNHKVDGGDLALMSGAWMQSGQGWAAGNFNGDPNGKVDGGDLALMGGNWMWSLPSPAPGSPALPEPGTLALLCLGVVAMTRHRRRGRAPGAVAAPGEVC